MRSALLNVFFTLIIRIQGIQAQDDNFRPIPIPLNDWHYDKRTGRTGTLHEQIITESPISAPAVPAHYWEDALRHSVYLALVRDKIDQLIAKGDVISPRNMSGSYDSKEIDDHDLWDNIKTAPFDRLPEKELSSYGDITIMAKGRLMEDNGRFRFAEDERTKEKCSDNNCLQGVKAFWSVKRVRQRDLENSSGKHNYELTFSVISQVPKIQRKPYDNPIRTFTVKESPPIAINENLQQYRKFGAGQTSRPERAIWFHRNIAPVKQTGRKHYFQGLDRIFSSIFSEDEEKAHDSLPQKYQQSPFVTQTPIYSNKFGHVGQILNEQHQNFPYRKQPSKYVRPTMQATVLNSGQYPYSDKGLVSSTNAHPYTPYSYDHRVESSQTIKTTRPAVLPTPLPPINHSGEVTPIYNGSMDDFPTAIDTTKLYKTYSKYKAPAKVSYFSEHIRPPIFNAPPGVFVTMDKKPFKPMPPLKLLQSSKPHRTNRPIDFRPSPQIHDEQNISSFSDSVFRPITLNFDEKNTSENLEPVETTKDVDHKIRKPTTSGKKPSKIQSNIKTQHTTIATPDIITAHAPSDEDLEEMNWANVLAAFTKTTPMFPQTEKTQILETTTPMTTTTTTPAITKIATTTEIRPEVIISTTVKPKKRTRPPPKFNKQDKIKKHKRVTTTSMTSTSTTKSPVKMTKKKPSQDLVPQASSAATDVTKTANLYRESTNNTKTSNSTIATTITSTKATTTRTIITTESPSTTTKILTTTTRPQSKNRFRQSTLIIKGTSLKHDRWNGYQKNQSITTPSSTVHINTHKGRRKGSNFQGYLTSTAHVSHDKEKSKEKESNHQSTSNMTASTLRDNPHTNSTTEETIEQYVTNSVLPLEGFQEQDEKTENTSDEDYEYDPKDHSEFIFQAESMTTTQSSIDIISTLQTPRNKTKCKRKRPNVSTTENSKEMHSERFGATTKYYSTTTRPSKEISTSSNILEEILNFTFDEENDKGISQTSKTDLQNEESSNHESFLKIDDFEDFLDIHLTGGKTKHSEKSRENNQYTNEDSEDLDEDNVDDEEEYENSNFQSENDGDEVHPSESSAKETRPYSLLELMAMS